MAISELILGIMNVAVARKELIHQLELSHISHIGLKPYSTHYIYVAYLVKCLSQLLVLYPNFTSFFHKYVKCQLRVGQVSSSLPLCI